MFFMNWHTSILLCLVIWRLAHLFTKEDGPFNIIYLLRKKAGKGFFGDLLDCFYCLSIWIALPFGLWQGHKWWQMLVLWLAYSGAACLLEQATASREYPQSRPDFFEDKN